MRHTPKVLFRPSHTFDIEVTPVVFLLKKSVNCNESSRSSHTRTAMHNHWVPIRVLGSHQFDEWFDLFINGHLLVFPLHVVILDHMSLWGKLVFSHVASWVSGSDFHDSFHPDYFLLKFVQLLIALKYIPLFPPSLIYH